MFVDAPIAVLTDEQERAVTHDAGNLLIVAGAGTGKTATLTARLAHLVESGVDPERILLLTFSRRAATELIDRAETLIGGSLASRCWGGTFHAVANRLLRRYGRAIGIAPDFTVLDQADAADLLALLRDEHDGRPEGTRRRARKDLLTQVLSRVINSRTPLSEVLDRHYPWIRDERDDLRETFKAYTARKRAHHVLDYDDLLLFWAALHDAPQTQALLIGRFEHVLVDEYQDTNALQADLLEGLVGTGATITAVGDDAQSIYGFRAATVRNIFDFGTRFDADVVHLTRNHRSTPEILAMTNAVMADASERHEKDLVAVRPAGARPELVSSADEHRQSVAVCERILEHVERGTPLTRQAVLFRTSHHSDLLELELSARKIPFVKFGGLRFLEAAHVKDLVCVLRLVCNPVDELAWFRLLQRIDGVGPARARRLVSHLATERNSLAAAIELGLLPPEAVDGTVDLVDAIDRAAVPGLVNAPAAQIECVRTWLDSVVGVQHGNRDARLADLDRLQGAAALSPSLSQFLTDLTLDPPASTGDLAGTPHLDDDHLTLSTIHSAKGGEWDVVQVIHLADGNLPSDLATGSPEEIDEERRLLYVALTRARDHLYAHAPLRYHHRPRRRDDAHGYAQISRFLTDEVRGHVDEVAERVLDPRADLPVATDAVANVDALVSSLLD